MKEIKTQIKTQNNIEEKYKWLKIRNSWKIKNIMLYYNFNIGKVKQIFNFISIFYD